MATSRSREARSKEYQSFRSAVSLKRIAVDIKGKELVWEAYDFGPREVRCPIVCLPPVSGTADVFYKQIVSLGSQGFRIIAVNYPIVWTQEEWCDAFTKLLDQLHLDQVHLLGASLGGFLAQLYAQHTWKFQRVQSLVLCNAFTDTAVFSDMPSPSVLKWTPSFVLRRMILANYPDGQLDVDTSDSIDFMIERMEALSRQQLASRLVLNVAKSYVEPQKIREQDIKVTVVDVMDQSAITATVKEDLYKYYPEGRLAHLKSGGNFPYLSRADEVTMFVKVHTKDFRGTRYTPCQDDLEEKPGDDAAEPGAAGAGAAGAEPPEAEPSGSD